ncbi:MAG TPA: oxidative damage protection protein [Candidatus Polarisedimenticolia bacterium]|jgi:Fe-S cluster biosynthesis and repair protein YggX
MAVITCARCAQEKETMGKPPFPGSTGRKIHERVCGTCWGEWQGMQTKIINEYRLSMSDPKSQEMLDSQMKTFLSLGD